MANVTIESNRKLREAVIRKTLQAVGLPNPSDEQMEILLFVQDNPQESLIVVARAGTGKSTLIEMILAVLPSSQRALVCAFNKNIAMEMDGRVSRRAPKAQVEVKTLHGFGNSLVRANWRGARMSEFRGWDLAAQACGFDSRTKDKIEKRIIIAVKDLASFTKGSLPFATEADLDEVEGFAWDKDLPCQKFDEVGFDATNLARCAINALARAKKNTGQYDFDDMVWLPVVNGWARPIFDTVIVDECQDMNKCQIFLAQSARKKSARMIVVGDNRQAIYGFRGADSQSLERLEEELTAAKLPLSITYRCPRLVVEQAAQIVEDYRAAEGAPEGAFEEIAYSELDGRVLPGDAILSRTNAPLVSACLRLLSQGVPCKIQGRDIGKTLIKLVREVADGTDDLVTFLASLQVWVALSVERIKRVNGPNEEKRIGKINDKAMCLETLAVSVDTVNSLVAKLEALFADIKDSSKIVLLSSVHKAKGLEWKNVYGLSWTLRSSSEEEQNLRYVMLTRAKHSFTYVLES